jgi:predicted GNAT family N-acyltransferase
MMNVISFPFSDKEHCDIAFEIRRKVFEEEQNVSREEEFDSEEASCRHYLVFIDQRPVGTARWRRTDKGIKLERFAVLKEHRNSGAGSLVLRQVMEDVLPLKERIYLHAQLPAVNFYERAGFVRKGEIFSEANIDHFLMVKLC